MEHRGAWQGGRGVVVSNLTQGRNMPEAPEESRINVGASDGDTASACDPPIVTLKDGQYTQSHQLRHVALQTPEYCINDLYTSFAFQNWMGHKRKELASVADYTWARWFTKDYYDLAGHNLTQQTAGAFDNASNGYSVANPPTAGLSFGLLEDINEQVFSEGELPFATDEDTGGAVGVLIMGQAQFVNLTRNDTTLRDNIRYAYMGARNESPILPGGTVKRRRLFGSYVIAVDRYPRRFDIVDDAYLERKPLLSTAVTKGTSDIIAPAWKYAQFEEVLRYEPSGYRSLVPNTSGVAGNGFEFKPQNYMGTFQALNIPHKTCNPRGAKMFFDAQFSDAAEPLNVGVMYTILTLNCGFNKGGPTCTPASSSSGSSA